ncbi:MAG TPA: hypothetical protein VK555_02310 [Terriglobales bacterium]|nr:hypothetical protein [Terriglobales bacterium]
MSYVRCAPSHRLAIVRAAENHFRAVNDNHDIANRRIPITPDLDFRRSVFAGHRNSPLCSKAVSISPSPSPRARPDEVIDAQGLRFIHNKPDDFVLRHRVALSYSSGKRQQIKRQCPFGISPRRFPDFLNQLFLLSHFFPGVVRARKLPIVLI